MICGTFTVKGVPEAKAARTKRLFEANDPPPTSVTSKKEDDGTYTVTAVFPKCPDNTTHSTDGD